MEQLIEQYGQVHSPDLPKKGKILLVASSPTQSGQTGWPIGFWASELTHPLWVFQEAGYGVQLASTQGGKLEMDSYSDPTDPSGYSARDVLSLGYLQQAEFVDMLENTQSLGEINPDDFVAIFLVGGQGPVYTFRGNADLEKLFLAFYESDKPCAAVCHATCLLLELKTSNGDLLVSGKTWTGFSDAEEDHTEQAVGMKIQPYRIETEARKLGCTTFKASTPFSSYAIRDGNLVTGQQQYSGSTAARMVIDLLESQRVSNAQVNPKTNLTSD